MKLVLYLMLVYLHVVHSQYFEAAALTVGLEFSVTGALGFRTVHQVNFCYSCALNIYCMYNCILSLKWLPWLHVGRAKGTNGSCCMQKLFC